MLVVMIIHGYYAMCTKPSVCSVQELHDQIHELLQDRDPKAQLDVQSSHIVQMSDASLPAASDQAVAPVVSASSEEEHVGVPPHVSAATSSQEEDQPGTEPPGPEPETQAPVTADSTAPGPVAEGDVAAESAQDMDTSTAVQAKAADLNDSVVNDYIQVQNPTPP